MTKILLAALVACAVPVSAASAADVYTPPAAFDWTGFYAGVNAGYGFGGEDKVGALPTYNNVGKLNIEGFFGGAQLGYNWQMDSIVLGLETDLQLSGISDSDSSGAGFRAKDDNTWFGTTRGRIGYAFDNALIYATGGVAYGGFDYRVTTPTANFKKDFTSVGYTVGGGVEYAFDTSWSMKLEYLYANFGSEKFGPAAERTKATPDFHSVKLGVNFRF